MPKSLKVIYVAGFGRSGTTLLDNILGQVPGVVSVGELMYVWDRGMIENRLCGCGTPFRECDFWRAAFDAAFGGFDGIDPAAMVELRQRADRPRHDALLMLGDWGRQKLAQLAGDRAKVFERLYQGIAAASGCDIIVDSSKTPCHAELLNGMPSVDPYVVQLVRDPRAVAFSWQRRKLLGDSEGYFSQIGSLRSAAMWTAEHLAIRHRWHKHPHYRLVRYEDLMRSPRDQVARILEAVGIDSALNPVTSGTHVTLAPCHGIGGNSSKFKTGEVSLRMDDEWRTKLRGRDRLVVSAISSPLLSHYSYPWRPDEAP